MPGLIGWSTIVSNGIPCKYDTMTILRKTIFIALLNTTLHFLFTVVNKVIFMSNQL